nr:hypothetical protein [Tanacetum cinerariifolium]
MMVQAPEDMGEGSEIPTDTHHTPVVTQPSSLNLKRSKNQGGNKGKKLMFLYQVVRYLMRKVLDLEEAKTAQAKEITTLKKRVQKLEQKRKSRTSGLKRLRKVGTSMKVESLTKASLGDQEDASKQGRMIDSIDQDVEITLVDETQRRMNEEAMFGVNDLDGDEVIVDVTAGENVEQSAKVAKKGVSTTNLVTTTGEVVNTVAKPKAITTATTIAVSTRPKEKGIVMQEPSETQEERLARLKEEETNTALIESWDNTQAMMDANCELAARLQEEERGELSIKEKSSEKAKEGSSKRAGSNLEQGDAKRQRLEEENESVELNRCLEIVPEDDDDVTIEATPLYSKSLAIVDYKIYKERRKSYFKIIRVDGNSKNYLTFGKMFKKFNREYLEILWSIVKTRFKKTKPINEMDNLLLQTLKTMFEHQVEDNIWKYQRGTVKVLNWKLFDSCEVYCITTKNMVY